METKKETKTEIKIGMKIQECSKINTDNNILNNMNTKTISN
jgi:hypothetical protein